MSIAKWWLEQAQAAEQMRQYQAQAKRNADIAERQASAWRQVHDGKMEPDPTIIEGTFTVVEEQKLLERK